MLISPINAIAKLFRHGRSQAVRLPKQFRFEGQEVRATKVGNRVILEPLDLPAAVDWELIDSCGGADLVREDPEICEDRASFDP